MRSAIDALIARYGLVVQGREPMEAVLSKDGRYRYMLSRWWERGDGWLVFIMLNPSTADGLTLDPTFRRCIGFAQAMGYRGVRIANLYAARSTNPDVLLEMDDPIGPHNDEFIRAACKSGKIVAGWGSHKVARRRDSAVLALIRAQGKETMCLGITGGGKPLHPLYVAARKKLELYHGR